MIKEYALDPHMEYNADKLRYYAEKFSLEQGRLIARFPKRWSKRLRENLQSRLPEVARKRAEFFLSRLEERIYDGKRPYNDEIDWLMNAENDHGRVPSQASSHGPIPDLMRRS
jgi:hypothetical protein